jgi:hypothetical protein
MLALLVLREESPEAREVPDECVHSSEASLSRRASVTRVAREERSG